ncbi:MAG: hypothetical protein MUF03_14210 [Rubrivivax sp.]|nr:hypothetical protein [Rubrivivax sp.]
MPPFGGLQVVDEIVGDEHGVSPALPGLREHDRREVDTDDLSRQPCETGTAEPAAAAQVQRRCRRTRPVAERRVELVDDGEVAPVLELVDEVAVEVGVIAIEQRPHVAWRAGPRRGAVTDGREGVGREIADARRGAAQRLGRVGVATQILEQQPAMQPRLVLRRVDTHRGLVGGERFAVPGQALQRAAAQRPAGAVDLAERRCRLQRRERVAVPAHAVEDQRLLGAGCAAQRVARRGKLHRPGAGGQRVAIAAEGAQRARALQVRRRIPGLGGQRGVERLQRGPRIAVREARDAEVDQRRRPARQQGERGLEALDGGIESPGVQMRRALYEGAAGRVEHLVGQRVGAGTHRRWSSAHQPPGAVRP